MTDALTIGWTAARTKDALGRYRRVLGLNLILHLLIDLACIFLPYWVSKTFHLPGPIPTGWVRGWGATLLLVTALYIPGFLDPVRHRAPNFIGILGRLWMAIIWTFCGGGFLWFAAFDFLFFLILAVLYARLRRNILMGYP